MENYNAPSRKRSRSFTDENMSLLLSELQAFNATSNHPQSPKAPFNRFSEREIASPLKSLEQKMVSLDPMNNLCSVDEHLLPFEICEKNARVDCVIDFVLGLLLTFLEYVDAEAEAKIERMFETRFDIQTEEKYTTFHQNVKERNLPIASESFLLIDCRFRYEFEGGHIAGAMNINDPNVIKLLFFDNEELLGHPKFLKFFKEYSDQSITLELALNIVDQFKASHSTRFDLQLQQSSFQNKSDPEVEHISDPIRTLCSDSNSQSNRREICIDDSLSLFNPKRKPLVIVFYCEYSSQRAPDMWRFLRSTDRAVNQYPYLHYSNIYLLKGGYHNFVKEFPGFCVSIQPDQLYIKMWDKRYSEDCNEDMKRLSENWERCNRKRKKKHSEFLPPVAVKEERPKRFSIQVSDSQSLFQLYNRRDVNLS
jgi:hypothetical protein